VSACQVKLPGRRLTQFAMFFELLTPGAGCATRERHETVLRRDQDRRCVARGAFDTGTFASKSVV
jgi:hypothetical protein